MAIVPDEMLDWFLVDTGLPYRRNVLPGHTKVQVSLPGTLLGLPLRHVAFRPVEYYYFGFTGEGVTLRQHQEGKFFGPVVRLPWEKLRPVRFSLGLLETRFSFQLQGEAFHMMLMRRMAGQFWVGENCLQIKSQAKVERNL